MIKRAFDGAVAAVALVVGAPLLALIALTVRVTIGRPVLFRQRRVGRNERVFEVVKFRTMLDTTDDHGELLHDDDRQTPFGRFLRSSSLDELPELWNVLRGDMSLVGPRPLLPEYLPLYSARQRRRHEVRPGITGLAQVSGRNRLSWPERLELDVQYVESSSFLGDLAILFRTVTTVLTARGISGEGTSTMEPFTGQDM